MNPQSFDQFTSRIAGEVIVPGSQAYDHVRTIFNQGGKMMISKLCILLGVASGIIMLLAACSTVAPSDIATSNTVHMNGSNFVQSSITIKKGESVTLVADTLTPHIIANGVSTSVATATAAIVPQVVTSVTRDFTATAPNGAKVESSNGRTVTRAPSGASRRLRRSPPARSSRKRRASWDSARAGRCAPRSRCTRELRWRRARLA